MAINSLPERALNDKSFTFLLLIFIWMHKINFIINKNWKTPTPKIMNSRLITSETMCS